MISAEIGWETTTRSPIATKNVSAIAPTETTYDWSSNVAWTVSYTACPYPLKWNDRIAWRANKEPLQARIEAATDQTMVKRWSNVKFLCSVKQATIIFKWLSRFWLALLIICVERGSQTHGISWQLAMYIERCVNKSKLLRYVRRIATETREKTWKLLFGPAVYSK